MAEREFIDADLSGARFTRADLSGATMRAMTVEGLDIDDPWLTNGPVVLIVNGVDVAPLVDGELNRRFPGRALRRAHDAAGLRAAWDAAEQAWQAALTRVSELPEGAVDAQVDDEWSFAQTLRHLVMATDIWLGRAILGRDELHPIGVPYFEYETDGHDMSVFSTESPSYAEVLRVRAERQAMVRDYLAGIGAAELAELRQHPWDPGRQVSVGKCLRTILSEEWEHLRYALRDLDALYPK